MILFDRVCTGLSDRGPLGYAFRDWVENISAVLTAVGSRRAALFGCHVGGRMALLFAATHPEQTAAVITFGAHPATAQAHDYPWGATPEERDDLIRAIGMGPPDPDHFLADAVRVPTLVLHRTGDRTAQAGASRYMAERLPQATFRELPGNAHLPFFGDQDAMLAVAQEFLTGDLPVAEADRSC